MTHDEAVEALQGATMAIGFCVNVLSQHEALVIQYRRERQRADTILPIVDPSLWMSQERQTTDDIMGPIFEAAENLLRVHREQTAKAKAALDAVKGEV